ncbi:MAG: oxygenase MpaB family protein [Nocardioidaceae bacterium]
MTSPLEQVRSRLSSMLFERVAGAEGPQRRDRIHHADGPRWFEPDSPIRTVHGDASMFVGGIRALLLQSLHPVAMAAVAGHSGYRGDPWGRLQRTSTFLAVTTFGSAADAEAAVAAVRRIHDRVQGVTDDGVPYVASDPHLLSWVHLAEVDSFLAAHQRYGARPLSPDAADEYVRQVGRVASALGADELPTTTAELRQALADRRPELRGTRQAREAARFMLLTPPLPVPARPGYALLASAAVGLMPWWTRWPLRLPLLPVAESTLVRAAGVASTATIRWALRDPAATTG